MVGVAVGLMYPKPPVGSPRELKVRVESGLLLKSVGILKLVRLKMLKNSAIGTDGQGIARLDGNELARFTMKEGLVNDFVRAFCEDREGGLWIGTDAGLSYWRGGTFRSFTAADGLIYGSIRGLLLDRDDSLWVATERGLTRFRSGAFVTDPLLERLASTKVWALHQDSEDGLWVGTQGAGLFLLKSGRLTQFTTDHGLPSNKIHFVGEDRQGNLWMSGPSGVVLGVAARSRIAPSARVTARAGAALRHHRRPDTNQMRGLQGISARLIYSSRLHPPGGLL